MNKQAFILAAALVAAGASQAQVYVGGAIGSSHLNGDCTGTTSCKNNDTGVKIFGGYDFGNGLSAELGYLDFGKFSATADGIAVKVKPSGLAVGGAYWLPMGSDWRLGFRLGLASIKTQAEASQGALRGSTSSSKAQAYAGLGLGYAVSKTSRVELGFDSTQAELAGEKATIRMLTVGFSYGF